MPTDPARIRQRAKAAVVASIRAAQGYKRTRVLHATTPIVPMLDSRREHHHMVTDPQYRSNVTGECCPRCASLLLVRTNRATQQQFYGCSGYPNCRYTRPYHGD